MILTREDITSLKFQFNCMVYPYDPRSRFENTIELKEAILQDWEALPQAVIDNAIDGFRSHVRLVIAENGQHIEKY